MNFCLWLLNQYYNQHIIKGSASQTENVMNDLAPDNWISAVIRISYGSRRQCCPSLGCIQDGKGYIRMEGRTWSCQILSVNRAPDKTGGQEQKSQESFGEKEELHLGEVSAGFEPGSSALQADSLPAELPGKPWTNQEAPKKWSGLWQTE